MWKVIVPVLIVALLGAAAHFFYQGVVARERMEQMAAPALAPAPAPAPIQAEELPVFDPNADPGESQENDEQAQELEDCLKEAMSDPATMASEEKTAQALKDCQGPTEAEE